MPKREPAPKIPKERKAPHYLVIPGLKRAIAYTLYDDQGYVQKGEYKAETVRYSFEPGQPTFVAKERHAIMLLERYADNGIVEVAHRELEPRVEEFYKPNSRRAYLMTKEEYNLAAQPIVIKTRRFEPVMDVVIRTGEEVAKQLLAMRREEDYDQSVLVISEEDRNADNKEEEVPLGRLKVTELRRIAAGENIEIPEGVSKKKDIIKVIEQAREEDELDEEQE